MTRRYTGGLLSATEQATDANTANGIFTLQEAGALTTAGNFPTGRWTPQRSLRFRASSSAYLNRTFGTPTNNKVWTWSAWVKRGSLSLADANHLFMGSLEDVGGNPSVYSRLVFETDGTLRLQSNSSASEAFTSSALFRDHSAWYHIVLYMDAVNTTVRCFVNGKEIAYASKTNPTNTNTAINRASYFHRIGLFRSAEPRPFDGYMADVNFIDGQALDPSYFGATDPETGTWVPKRYVGTYGNNGSYLPFSDNTATSTLGKSFAPNNYFTYSEQFDNVAWSKYQSSVTANAAVAPDGATTADKLVGTTGTSGDHQVYQSGMVTAVDNGVYTLSCYAKQAERSVFRLYIQKRDGSTYAYGDFDLATGTVYTLGGGPYAGATQTITSVGNGWYRCSITVNIGTGAGGVSAIISYATPTGETAGYGLYIWGAQINTGSTALDYTATTSSASANDWTGNNFSLTSGVTYDSMVDVPGIASVTSQPDIGGVQRGNYATWSQLTPPTQTSLSQGNLFSTATGSSTNVITTFPTPTTGKWYAEITMNFSQNINWPIVMGVSDGISGNTYLRYYTDWSARAINKSVNGVTSSVTPSGALPVNGDILKIAYDADAGNLWLGLNSTWYGASGSLTGAPETGNDPTLSGVARKEMYPNHNSAGGPAQNAYLNCGQRPFTYTPPTGYKSLCTTNLPNPKIKRPSDHFDVKTWTGNGTALTVGTTAKQTSAVQINKSLRFRASASAYLTRTLTTPTSAKAWTFSAWVKRAKIGSAQSIFISTLGGAGVPQASSYFTSSDTIQIYDYTGSAYTFDLTTSQTFKDTSAWYHLVFVYDSAANATSNRVRLYVNGTQITSFSSASFPSLNADCSAFNRAYAHYLSQGNAQYFDGYMAEVNFIDGQALTPASFGQFDANNNWMPKRYTGTFGTNGFYLPFNDPTSTTTIGYDRQLGLTDSSKNNWTSNSISVTAGATYDSMFDSPADTVDSNGNVIGNYATLNPNFNIGSATISNGGLTLSSDTSGAHKIVPATLPVSKGKWYFEMSLVTSCSNAYAAMGFIPYPTPSSTYYTNLPSSVSGSDGFSWQTGTGNNSFWFDYTSSAQFVTVATGSASAVGDKLQIAIDIDNNKIWAGRNNTWYDASGGSTGNPSTGANPTATNVINYISKYGALVPYCSIGQGNTIIANFGQSPFAYTPPTGFKSINTKNLNDVGSSNLPNNYGNFVNTPDLVWLKSSSSASYGHRLTDTVRGPTRQLLSHDTGAQSTDANGLQAFLPNGFNVGSGGDYNTASQTYVSWNWNRGKIPGFDIVNYSGNGGVQTINHNLGVAPSWLVVKKLSTATNSNWMVYHSSLGPTKALNLNNTSTAGTTYWNSTSPTSNTFTLDSNGNYNSINDSYIAYLWAEVPGFSKFGAYTNNNSTDGVFIYTGFRPKFVLIKNHDNVEEWYILDSVRQTYNQAPPMSSSFLKPNSASGSSGSTTSGIDLLSNGFKIRTTNPASGEIGFGTRGYIYCAFAETPFKYANAR